MKKIFAIIFLFLTFPVQSEKLVRGAKPYGFFADFLWAINHIEFCIDKGKTPVIYWGKESSYFSPKGYNGSTNVWEYYFEPVSKERYKSGDFLYLHNHYAKKTSFTAISWYYQYIESKYKLPAHEQKSFKPIQDHEQIYLSKRFDGQRQSAYPLGNEHLYSISFRQKVKKQIIDQFIKIKPSVMQKITDFHSKYIAGKKTVGIHLRGNHIFHEVLPVPLEYIFEEANHYADQGYQFFIATDQRPLIEAAKKNIRGKVIYYECERFEKTTSPYATFKLHPKLGEDILIEVYLLSMTNHFVHTLSNVSTAVLYFNPNLSHTLIY